MSILTLTLNPTIDVSSDVQTIQHTHKIRTFNQRTHPGGGGINVARIVSEMGGTVEAAILLGGAMGALLEDTLNEFAFRSHVVRIAGPTRIAFMVHEETTGQEYRFVPEGPVVSETELAEVSRIIENFSGQFVVGSGSIPRGAPSDIYAVYSRVAERRGCRFIVDTSGAALVRTLREGHVFLAKPSRSELETLLGAPVSQEEVGDAAQSLIRQGLATYLCVTLGGEGAILVSAETCDFVPAKKLEVRSAVGAGDSFMGALVWALSTGKDIRDAFHYGVSAGAAAVLTPGTELCKREDVLRFYEEG